MTNRIRASHYEALEKKLMSARDRERDYQQEIEQLKRGLDEANEELSQATDRLLELERENVSLLRDVHSTQSLAEIRAEAGREGWLRCAGWMKKAAPGSNVTHAANKHAQQIREGKE